MEIFVILRSKIKEISKDLNAVLKNNDLFGMTALYVMIDLHDLYRRHAFLLKNEKKSDRVDNIAKNY